MKRQTWIYVAVCTLALTMFGCPEDKDEPEASCTTCENNQNVDKPGVKGAYVSGHLGNYGDCPGDGYGGAGISSEGRPAGDFAPCEEGTECTYYPMNCDDAQVTLRLTNSGQATALGMQVIKIELFDADGNSKAVLPLIEVTDTATNATFDGAVEVGTPRTLRVDFLGPESPHDLLSSSDADVDSRFYSHPGKIEVTFSAENHADVVVLTGELYPVPSVDT
ncbi:MAG: hypothetical protein H0U74_11175 [Bradymonadaceae bacterium]|nr:hypothetical protein [Lujinxingiaceae bacterium]